MKFIKYMKPVFIFPLGLCFNFYLISSSSVFGVEKTIVKENNVTYEYQKYEKFDFEDLSIDAELVTPGDVSIYDNVSRKFINNLPYRKNFNKEIRKAVERIN